MITRDVEASAVADLALSPPRAALAATVDNEILVVAVSVTLDAPADPASSPRMVQVPQGNPDLAGRNVVVIAEDGPQWFRLRSLTVRGMAEPWGDCTYRVVPERIVAWDYDRAARRCLLMGEYQARGRKIGHRHLTAGGRRR